jgi:hypothetical protein
VRARSRRHSLLRPPIDSRSPVLYIYTVHISVTILMEGGKRLSQYAIKTSLPAVGWLHYEVDVNGVRARVVDEEGRDVLDWLERARLVACRGTQGALIVGVNYRKKGSKHSIADKQAWWCEAPPRTKPLLAITQPGCLLRRSCTTNKWPRGIRKQARATVVRKFDALFLSQIAAKWQSPNY